MAILGTVQAWQSALVQGPETKDGLLERRARGLNPPKILLLLFQELPGQENVVPKPELFLNDTMRHADALFMADVLSYREEL